MRKQHLRNTLDLLKLRAERIIDQINGIFVIYDPLQ